MIQYLHVGMRSGKRWLFADLDFEVRAGECVFVEGPPGSGKSTLMDMALGECVPSAGSVFVNGVNPARASARDHQHILRGVSLVRPEEPQAGATAEGWVALGAWCAGIQWGRAREAAREIMAGAGLAEVVREDAAFLTDGQKAALVLARSLVRRPHLLLVDYPGLAAQGLPCDPAGLIAGYVKEGGACLMTGPSAGWAPRLGGRTFTLAAPAETP